MHIKFETFSKKDVPDSWVNSEITDSKKVVKKRSKKLRFRGPFHKQHCKGDQILLKPEPHHLYHIYWSLLRWKKCLLVIYNILGLFVKALNAGHRYSLLNRENLKKPIQMQLSQKQKLFVEQRIKGDQTLLKFEQHLLCHVYWSLWRELSWKKCLLVICKIVEMFLKTWNAGHKYCLLYSENLKKPIQMQLSQKPKLFFNLFLHFWNLD